MEAAVFGNIAFCYGKDQHDKAQIDYCTKVIDRSLYIEDINVLIKAYLRRGLALEHLEKYKPAVNDLIRVRELQPMNKQAQQAMVRCQKYIKQDEGINYTPNLEDISLPDLPELKPQEVETPEAQPVPQAAPAKVEEPVKEPVKEPAVVKEEVKEEEPAPKTEEVPSTPSGMSAKEGQELEDKLAALKEKCNN